MSIADQINQELVRSNLSPLTEEQVLCLDDSARLNEAAGMLEDLRDRCGVRLPVPSGNDLCGPFASEEDARDEASLHCTRFAVVVIDRMATDESRSTGDGDEYYVSGYKGADAAVALAGAAEWVATWVEGEERLLQD